MFSLHCEALGWLRYGKRLPIVCTEAGAWNADVIGMNEDMCIEVEVKKSISDLKAEFKNKPQKHYVYAHAKEFDPRSRSGYVPNWYYFFVPAAMEEKTVDFVEEKAPAAGVAVLKYPSYNANHVGGGGVMIAKRAKRLHDRAPSRPFLNAAMLRMGSEICRFRIAFDALRKEAITEELVHDVIQQAAHANGMLDFEDLLADTETRAAELAMAVEQKNWKDIPERERFQWIFAAHRLLQLQRYNPKVKREAGPTQENPAI